MEKLNGELQSALQRTELRKFSTIVKMTVYLLCYFLENYEASKRVVQEFGLLSIENKNKEIVNKFDLVSERKFALGNLVQLIRIPIYNLLSLSKSCTKFFNLHSNFCEQLLKVEVEETIGTSVNQICIVYSYGSKNYE